MVDYNQNYQSILILILLQNNSIEISENFSLGSDHKTSTGILFFHLWISMQKYGRKE
jgi:hypothetical protein